MVSIALVVDLSGSMKGKPVEEAKAVSTKLLDALLYVEGYLDLVAFFGINRDVAPGDRSYDPAVEVPFTNDKNAVLNVVNLLTVENNKPTLSTIPSSGSSNSQRSSRAAKPSSSLPMELTRSAR